MTTQVAATVEEAKEGASIMKDNDDEVVMNNVRNPSDTKLQEGNSLECDKGIKEDDKKASVDANGIVKSDVKSKTRVLKQGGTADSNHTFKYSRIFKKVSPDGNLVSFSHSTGVSSR